MGDWRDFQGAPQNKAVWELSNLTDPRTTLTAEVSDR